MALGGGGGGAGGGAGGEIKTKLFNNLVRVNYEYLLNKNGAVIDVRILDNKGSVLSDFYNPDSSRIVEELRDKE